MIYFWYSGATDVTGRALAEALDVTGTKDKPELNPNDIIVGWGTKIRRDIEFPPNVNVINHPNSIRANRNKYKALNLMYENNSLRRCIAKFASSDEVLNKLANNNLTLPLIGRKKFHQGGKGFWVCLTKSHVEHAISDGAEYFQEYIDIKTEYRAHVLFGNVVKLVKKVARPEPQHWIDQRMEKIRNYAEKNNMNIDNETLELALRVLVKEVTLPDLIIRSNKRGWVFNNARNNLPRIKEAAIKAIEVLGLDFGAVDCAVDSADNPFIIEVNSGPGLTGDAFDRYVEAFREKFDELLNNRRNRPRRRAVGAAEINENDNEINIDELDNDALALLIKNVNTDEEAKAVLRLLARRQ